MFKRVKNAAGMLLPAALICGIYRKTRLRKKRKEDYELLKKQNEYYRARYKEMEKQWEKLRRVRHELGNRYILALSYLENKRYEDLKRLCLSEIEDLRISVPVINTGNMGIDSIVSFKLWQAAARKIEVEREIRIGGKVLVEDRDMNSLLGNLFDNAFEACAGIPAGERKIRFKLSSDATALYFEMANCFDGQLKKSRRGEMLTTKTDRRNHGIGLKIVKSIVEKYQGDMRTQQKKNWFEIKGLLYFKNIGKKK